MEHRIGRERECEELSRAMSSPRSEFVILYGRRRIGKTFLVRSFFNDRFDFHFVGAHKMRTSFQLRNFRNELARRSGNASLPSFDNWVEAFEHLENYLAQLPADRRKVLFFDEMPWIDTKQSDFVAALEYFWNSWVSIRDDIVLIACGSATSWMADKLLDNPGGLHNRITRQIYLRPFTLHECQQLLDRHGFNWGRHQIIQAYMVLGGVPYYWSLLEPQLSFPQNVDRLCFWRDGRLRDEFDELYNALFNKAERYISVVQCLARHPNGMTRQDLVAETGTAGGQLTKILKNLERCDFIAVYCQFGKRTRDAIYRLGDFYTLFYFKFIHEARDYDEDFWVHHFQSPAIAAWEGLTFELVCLAHLRQIKQSLGIAGVATQVTTWRYVPGKSRRGDLPQKGAQIDLLIARADKLVHLCEIKFADGQFRITSEYEQHLRERMEIFRQVTGITHGLVHTFITPCGVASGAHSSMVHSEVTAKELFAP